MSKIWFITGAGSGIGRGIGEVSGVTQAAGVSPSQASPETILKVDLYGRALVLEEFGNVIARGMPVEVPVNRW